MSSALKALAGLAAALLVGWIAHGPAGRGAAFVDRLDAGAKAVIRDAGLPVQVRFERDPLRREAILSGQANDLQRHGMGSLPGLDDRVRAVPGVSSVRWEGD
jgi:hypothetical protein